MKLLIEVNQKTEIERVLTIFNLGMLTALENKLISIEEAECYLFNPYTEKKMVENQIELDLVEIVQKGCELEDVQSLFPEQLEENISGLKRICMELMGKIERPQMPINKLIKELGEA